VRVVTGFPKKGSKRRVITEEKLDEIGDRPQYSLYNNPRFVAGETGVPSFKFALLSIRNFSG
jgi:hypothetical protein